LTFALSLTLYIVTTAPDLLPADSGEFQIVAPLLGVAHPPGYPLYTMLGRLFTWLIPFGTVAYRLNLMSAFLAAGTLTLIGAATRHWARHMGVPAEGARVGGMVAVVTLGTATTFWSQASMANIRMPTMFFAALGLYALARYAAAQNRTQADRSLGLLALALGLGITHHPSLIFLGIFFVVYLFLIDPRILVQPQRWWRPLLLALVGLPPLIYLPLRGVADAPLAPPNLDTLDGFMHHIRAEGFAGDMFAFANAQDLPQRLILLPTLFLFQFNRALLMAAVLGLVLSAWRDRRLVMLLVGGLILHTFVSITYRAPQTIEYLMPAYLPIAILAGLATAWLTSIRSLCSVSSATATSLLSSAATLMAAATLLAGLANGLDHGPSFFTLVRDRSTRAATESILERAPPEALILADWHWATPLWYLQWVEGQRLDVEVRYVYPVSGQEYGDTWKDRIEAVNGERPLLLTHFYHLPDYTLEPLGQGFWVHERPYRASLTELAGDGPDLTPLDAVFDGNHGGVHLLGYRLDRLQPTPGETIELTLAWQVVGSLAAAPSFSARLMSGDGGLLAQADRALGTDYAPGEIRFERLVLPLYPSIPPGDYRLAVEVYSAHESGFENWPLSQGITYLDLATLSIRPRLNPPLTLHPVSAPFVDGPTLVGVDYDRTVPSTLRLYLHWRGPAQGSEQVHVEESMVRLPALSDGAYQTLMLDLPGEIKGRLRLTLTGADDQTRTVAGPWGWSLQELYLPAPAPTARYVPIGDEMALISVSPAKSASFAPGDQFPLRPTFLALKPLVSDDAVSVRLSNAAGQWLYPPHDLQPALGALPTLKWIRGSRVIDPHSFPVPNDIAGDALRASLVVYERFRGTTLPPLDGRMDEVPLGEWAVMER
jgi:hypothetical protein